jgi:hypothetical protein
MKISKMGFVGGMALSAFAGMALAACSSSDNPPNNPQNGTDSGVQTQQDSGTSPPMDSGTTPPVDSGTTPPTDSGSGTCAKPPGLHIPQPDGGVYCPFSYNDATDAGIQYCSGATPQCCVSPASDAGISDCEAIGPCASSTFKVWQCSSPSDCAGITSDAGTGPTVCCLVSGAVEPDPKCAGFQKTKGLDSVTCTAASACQGPIMTGGFTDTHYVACEQQADCDQSASAFGGDGGTCTPVKASGTAIGLCL